jgi:uncharacterized protein (TIGR03067 family)
MGALVKDSPRRGSPGGFPYCLILLLVVSSGLLDATGFDEKAAIKKDQERLDGRWKLIKCERDGQDKTQEEKRVRHTVYFSGDQLQGSLGFAVFHGHFVLDNYAIKLDPSRKPKEMNLARRREEGKPRETLLGIYELDGDRLSICWAAPGQKRPDRFITKAGSKWMLVVYERDKD